MKLFELQLKIGDLVEARHFYHDILNLPVLLETPDVLALQVGSTRLIFERVVGWQGKYHFAFDVPENQINEATAWITGKAKLATLNGQTIFNSSHKWNANMVYFYDPAGNILEFIGRHNQPNASTEPFSERSIIAISEIGLVTRDVQQTVKWLGDTLGMSVYDGAGSDSFSAVGDESGLFIVVRSGRVWYPETGIPAGLNPVSVTLMDGKIGEYDIPGLPYHITCVE
jgi:catechol-2,3-dioxygenase